MNQLLQDNLLAIILILFLVVLILILVLTIVLVKFLLKKNEAQAPIIVQNNPPATEPEKKKYTLVPEALPIKEKFFCGNHPEEPSTGPCMICEDVFCEACLVEHEGLYFCKEHFKIYVSNTWKQITDVKTTPNNPEDGLFIYDFKRMIWNKDKTPSFVVTHYKINIEEDYIESYVQLNVIEDLAEKLEMDISKYKAKH